MKISEFLQGRSVARQAVTRYINRHDEIFNKKLEQESPDFSQERNALFLFLYQLLSVLVPDVLFYNLFAHIPQSTHVVTVAP